MTTPMPAHVVMVEEDDTGEDGVIVTRVVVNGTDVGRLAEAPEIKVGTSNAKSTTTVILTLVVSRLEIRGEHADGDRQAPAGFGFTRSDLR